MKIHFIEGVLLAISSALHRAASAYAPGMASGDAHGRP